MSEESSYQFHSNRGREERTRYPHTTSPPAQKCFELLLMMTTFAKSLCSNLLNWGKIKSTISSFKLFNAFGLFNTTLRNECCASKSTGGWGVSAGGLEGDEEEADEERWEEIMLTRWEAIRGYREEVEGLRSCLESIAEGEANWGGEWKKGRDSIRLSVWNSRSAFASVRFSPNTFYYFLRGRARDSVEREADISHWVNARLSEGLSRGSERGLHWLKTRIRYTEWSETDVVKLRGGMDQQKEEEVRIERTTKKTKLARTTRRRWEVRGTSNSNHPSLVVSHQ